VQNKKVLDVAGGRDAEGQNVQVWNRHKGANQRWRIVYVDSSEDQVKGLNKDFGFFINRPFYIVSRMPMRRVVDVEGNYRLSIRRLVKDKKSQLFVFDGETKTVKSNKWNGRSLNIQSSGRSADVYIQTTTARWW
jgi:hypothetical protein